MRSYGIALRQGSRAAIFSRASRCLKFPVQTGETCLEIFKSMPCHQTEKEMCSVCVSVYHGASSSNVVQGGLIHHHAHREWTKPSSAPIPRHILTMKQEEEKASFLKCLYSKTSRASYYESKHQRAKTLLDEWTAKWRVDQARLNERKRQEIRELHTLGSFGDPQSIRTLLFHLSTACLDPRELAQLTFSISSDSGNDKKKKE